MENVLVNLFVFIDDFCKAYDEKFAQEAYLKQVAKS